MSTMDSDLPMVTVPLWHADAVVLFDWLMTTDLNTVPPPGRGTRQRGNEMILKP